MEVLEGRAAVREQLGRLEEALEDGNRMLKVELTNPRVQFICERNLIEGIYLSRTFVGDEKEI
jgi:hypothetical protein